MKHIWKQVLALGLLILIFVMPALALEPGTAVVIADWLNFRDKPDMDGKVLALVKEGSQVQILEVLDDWCRVSWDGKEGYMSSRYLKQDASAATSAPSAEPTPAATSAPSAEPTPAATPAPSSEPTPAAGTETGSANTVVSGVLTGDGVRFRSGPNLDAGVYGYLYCGDKVTVLGQEGDWYKVEYKGKTGYLFGQYVRVVENSPGSTESAGDTAKEVIALAKANLGARYVYGGTSSSGFDCSGLTYYCFVNCGFTMNRTASQQYKQGSYVEKSNLQPGDLVFFSSPGSSSIGHVGLYIGDGEFIHASSGSAKVIISELDSWYWSTYYYGARRIIT